MSGILLVAWVALLGADRLDLAGGRAGAVLTPYLVLTPLLVLAQWSDRRRRGAALSLPSGARRYATLLLLFLLVIGASVYVSPDPATSLARAVLLILQSVGTLAVALHVAADAAAPRQLERGAEAGVLLFLVMNGLAVASFLGALPAELQAGPASLRLDSYGYAGIVPRLSGTVIDPNLAGLVLLFFAMLARRTRWLAAVLLVFTLSRSAALAGMAMVAVALHARPLGDRPAPRRAIVATLAIAASLLLWVGSSPARLEGAGEVMAPFAERLSLVRGGSASDHGSLLVRAAEEGTRSIPRMALGLGWGASYTVLQDFFPGNRYGNFHSLYATAFVEGGVPAAVLILLLLGVPLTRAHRWRGMIAGLAAFSLFYQATTDPAFWFALAMAWLVMPAARHPVPVSHSRLAT
ncbi:MAG: hypothetical protein ACYC3Q_14195 [Gemmatimonadaceae bacterium]